MGVTVATLTQQTGWRICTKCASVFFAGGTTYGVCKGGGAHVAHPTPLITLTSVQAAFNAWQSGWRWCRKCQCMFFGGNATKGSCPGGGAHDGSQSTNYTLFKDGPGWDNVVILNVNVNGFRWCRKCEQLGYKFINSKCSTSGTHDYSYSGVYSVVPFPL